MLLNDGGIVGRIACQILVYTGQVCKNNISSESSHGEAHQSCAGP